MAAKISDDNLDLVAGEGSGDMLDNKFCSTCQTWTAVFVRTVRGSHGLERLYKCTTCSGSFTETVTRTL